MDTLYLLLKLRVFLAFPGYERKVNQKALEQYLSFQYAPLEETFFKGIYKLMPGHMLLYKNGNYEIKTYFKTKLTPGKWNSKTNMDQLRSQLAEILKDSVKHHMLSDVEVGAFLSGGSGLRVSGFCLRCRSGIHSGI